MNKNKKGFTLVELVIVIAVIGILAAVLIPTFSNVIENSKKAAAQQTVSSNLVNYIQATGDGTNTIADYTTFIYGGYVFVYEGGSLGNGTKLNETSSNVYTSVSSIKLSAESNGVITYTKGNPDTAVSSNEGFTYSLVAISGETDFGKTGIVVFDVVPANS